MKLSATAKVGLVTLLSALLMIVSLSWLSQMALTPRGYRLKLVFSDVDGLLPGANVLLMGVRVGRVLSLSPQDRHVLVDLEIRDSHTRLLSGSHFKVLNKGIIGEKNLEIFPPEHVQPGAGFIAPESTLYGETPPRLDAAIEQANKALRSFRDLAEAPETQLAFKDGMRHFQTALRDLEALIRHSDEAALKAQVLVDDADSWTQALDPEQIHGIVEDVQILMAELRKGYRTLEKRGDPFGDTGATLNSLKNLTAKLESIASQAESLAADPKLKSDVKDFVASSRRTMDQVSTVAANPPRLSPRFSLMGAQDPLRSYPSGNFNMGLRILQDSFLIGVEEIGEQNCWNASWGKPGILADGLGFHLGMIRSKIGAGLDWTPANDLEVTSELFSPLAPEVRFAGTYYPSWWGRKIGLTGAWIRTLGPNNNQLYIGAQWRPLD